MVVCKGPRNPDPYDPSGFEYRAGGLANGVLDGVALYLATRGSVQKGEEGEIIYSGNGPVIRILNSFYSNYIQSFIR
ncbi:protein of unknown function [Hyphomicrobium sp. MC1]|nr:protein of unknown function [Hyphomicrobium sp. MC1]